jgi:DNA-binding transcriptional ArsR family regulator
MGVQAAQVVWEALADPVRREILTVLRDGDTTAGTIAARFAISRPAVSRHLRVLREAGLAWSEVRGQERVYRLAAEPLAEVDAWLRQVTPARRPSPATRLDALETELRRGRKKGEVNDGHRSTG